MVRARRHSGIITLTAKANGLPPATLTIQSQLRRP
jgi:hypothetical protein